MTRTCPHDVRAAQIGGKLQTVATLARAGIIRPQRPDRLLRAGARARALGRDAGCRLQGRRRRAIPDDARR